MQVIINIVLTFSVKLQINIHSSSAEQYVWNIWNERRWVIPLRNTQGATQCHTHIALFSSLLNNIVCRIWMFITHNKLHWPITCVLKSKLAWILSMHFARIYNLPCHVTNWFDLPLLDSVLVCQNWPSVVTNSLNQVRQAPRPVHEFFVEEHAVAKRWWELSAVYHEWLHNLSEVPCISFFIFR